MSVAQPAVAIRPPVYTVSFLALCLATVLGYSQNSILQPVLPLYVLHLGGSAALVGAIVAAFSLPSIVARPFIARRADATSIHGTWAIGSIVLTVASVLYLIPSVIVLFGVRILHGTGWAAFNIGGHSTLAKTAPAARRGEASSFYNLMPGIAQLVMPAFGLLLVNAAGFQPVFVVSAICGALALTAIHWGPVPRAPGSARPPTGGVRDGLLERGAVLPGLIEFLFTSSVSLYFTFLPVFALDKGIPLDRLAVFFPIYGIIFVVARVFVGPYADRIGRRNLLALSVAFGATGLAIGLVANDLLVITVSGAFYAVGASLESPASMALAIDRSDPGRLAAAMATYSLGYQMAVGIGAAVFGLVVDAFGFPAPFALALVSQLILGLIIASQWRGLPTGRRQSKGVEAIET